MASTPKGPQKAKFLFGLSKHTMRTPMLTNNKATNDINGILEDLLDKGEVFEPKPGKFMAI